MEITREAKLVRSIDRDAKLLPGGTCEGTRVVVEAAVDEEVELEEALVVEAEEPPELLDFVDEPPPPPPSLVRVLLIALIGGVLLEGRGD